MFHDWIWTQVLWCQKRLLSQLYHNHCPKVPTQSFHRPQNYLSRISFPDDTKSTDTQIDKNFCISLTDTFTVFNHYLFEICSLVLSSFQYSQHSVFVGTRPDVIWYRCSGIPAKCLIFSNLSNTDWNKHQFSHAGRVTI